MRKMSYSRFTTRFGVFVGKLAGLDSVCTLHFEYANNVFGSRGSFIIDPFKVIRGLLWLKSNNRLYASVSDLNLNSSRSFLPASDFESISDLEHVTFAPPPCGTRGRIGPTPPSCEVSKNLTE